MYKGTSLTYGMGWGGQFMMMIPSKHTVIIINESIADATAFRQSIVFADQVFPVIYKMIQNQ